MTEQDAMSALQRFRSTVEHQSFSRVGKITISIGFSALQAHDTPTDAIDRADEALYFAKHNGRNQVACYERLIAAGDLSAKEIAKGEVELF
jgi:diguanylate cyclase (GGDEF)-like protein